MSTAFTLHLNACQCCGRSEERFHLGQRTGGWLFLWKGYTDPSSAPKRQPLTTRAQWVALIKAEGSVVWDEYETKVPADEFLKMAIDWDTKNKRNHREVHHNACWDDPEGANFLGARFE